MFCCSSNNNQYTDTLTPLASKRFRNQTTYLEHSVKKVSSHNTATPICTISTTPQPSKEPRTHTSTSSNPQTPPPPTPLKDQVAHHSSSLPGSPLLVLSLLSPLPPSSSRSLQCSFSSSRYPCLMLGRELPRSRSRSRSLWLR